MENQYRCPYCNASPDKDGNILHESVVCTLNMPREEEKTIESNNKKDSDNRNTDNYNSLKKST